MLERGAGRAARIGRRWGAACVLAAAVAGYATPAAAGPTYYVDAEAGDDARTAEQAQAPGTPWQSIKRAVDAGGLRGVNKKGKPLAGYTVVVGPGLYAESVESKRDGLAEDPVVFRAATAGAAIIQPPAGRNGVFVSHHHHVIEGLVVRGGTQGLKLGPHDGGDGPVNGVVARGNEVYGNTSHGIQFVNSQGGEASFNLARNNGVDGINHSGNAGKIHDNVARDNGRHGIFVRDGVDHQLWNNTASGNGVSGLKVQGALLPPPGGRTFYVGPGGNDSRNDLQAQDPATPWATIRRGLSEANRGDTVAILPGTYAVSVESLRDGAPAAPITIRAAQPGTVTIAPPAGSAAVVIAHHHHAVEGLIVTGGSSGLQMGPYKQTGGEVHGLVARGNWAHGNGTGIKFTNVVTATAADNEAWDNRRDGIAYVWANQSNCPAGSGISVTNNLVVGNGRGDAGDFGVKIGCGDRTLVSNNTIWGNLNGGVRVGVAGAVPVRGQVIDNIIGASPVGVKEPAGSVYQGQVQLDFNNVYNTPQPYALGPATRPGPGSIALPPGFVNAAGGDYRLGRVATGQPVDSPMIDRGSDTADAVGLAGRTAFTDKYPDLGRVDLGYHETRLAPAEGQLTVARAGIGVRPAGLSLSLSATLTPSHGDGLALGADYVHVALPGADVFLWPAGFSMSGAHHVYADPTGAVSAVLDAHADGSVTVSLEATGLPGAAVKSPTSLTVRVGDDYGSATLLLEGMLATP